jgi:hypothetical protein
MINLKQEELIKRLIKDIQQKFPEVKLLNVTFSPENPDDLWVKVTAPEDEEREFELRDYSADLSMDILLDYGYHIAIMPTRNPESAKLWPSVEFSMEEN